MIFNGRMNKWTNEQMNATNALNDSIHLNHCYIDHSLTIEHLSHWFIVPTEGGV